MGLLRSKSFGACRLIFLVVLVCVFSRSGYGQATPVLEVSPLELNFLAKEGGENPASEVLSIWKGGGTGPLNWEVTEECDWLVIEPNSGTSMGEVNDVNVLVDISGLTGGTYNCQITVTADRADNSPQIVDVNLVVVGPALEISANSFEFTAKEGGLNPTGQILSISNTGGGTLNWGIIEGCSWLIAEPNSGSSTGEVDDINLGVDISGLAKGSYSCQLTVSDSNASKSPQIVDVNLVVVGPVLEVFPESLYFKAFEGGGNPPEQILSISNTGGGTLNWEIIEDCEWLTTELNIGSSKGEVNEVNISVDITGMSAGDYYRCELIISDPNASDSPRVVKVSLNVYSCGTEEGQIYGWGSSKLLNDQTLTDISKIAAGFSHNLALKSDGSIVGWGLNGSGQAIPPEGEDFIAVAAGYGHGLALKSDGSIVGWGAGELGETGYPHYGQAIPPDGNDFVAIAAGMYHSLALKSDGSIVGWGWDDDGQATPPAGNDFIAIAAGQYHSLALKSDGSIVGWGYDYAGSATPPDGNDFIAIAAGSFHSLALKSNGSIVGWGSDYSGQATPPVGTGFVAIAAGHWHSLALKSNGSIVGWGRNTDVHGGYCGQAIPPDGNDFIAIAAGGYHSLAFKSDGSVVGWGNNDYGQVTHPEEDDFIAIATGGYHSLALKSDGSIVGWGSNHIITLYGSIYYGQAIPPDGNDYVAISAGFSHSLALKSDGSIVGWGSNSYGEATPPDGNDFIAISAGYAYSLALKSDGSIVGWGYDYHGQATPPDGDDFIAIAAGRYHSLALKTDCSIIGWGSNYCLYGEYCGQATPPDGDDFIAIAAGDWHNLALKSDDSIVGWGRDNYGQATPPDGNDFIAIAAGGWHNLAIKSDGSIVGWGYDNYGKSTPPEGEDFIAIAAGYGHSLAIRYSPFGDLNNDRQVNMLDFAVFGDAWFSDPNMGNWDAACDISEPADGVIDGRDLEVLAGNWLEGTN